MSALCNCGAETCYSGTCSCHCVHPGHYCKTRMSALCSEFDVSLARRSFSVSRLLGKRRGPESIDGIIADHVSCYVGVDGAPALMTFQPYIRSITEADRAQARAQAAELGLELIERADLSWYLFGSTTLFILRRKEVPAAA